MTKFDERKIWEQLIIVAFKDNKLTTDELNLLKTTLADFEQYDAVLKLATSDGVIDDIEKLTLLQMRLQIMASVEKIAKADNHISADEKNLILAIHEILKDLQDQEFIFTVK